MHLTVRLDAETSDLAETLRRSGDSLAGVDADRFGLVGLHTCGDLGPILVRNFARTDQIKFLAVVGCCYMKMNLTG